jgi:hypothetical protein
MIYETKKNYWSHSRLHRPTTPSMHFVRSLQLRQFFLEKKMKQVLQRHPEPSNK